ncbi:hypothetical protein [Novosphingobium gossypii]|uniref:hypothetical protein n=1 Tax=Novosphingobium gossypii TaxID=1604774 RepID=UPI003D1E43F0
MAEIKKPIFVDPVPLGTVAVSSAQAGHAASALGRLETMGLTWRSSGTGAIWARGMFEEEKAIDFLAIISANAQPGTTYRLRLGATQAEVDGAAPYDSGALPFISPAITRDDGLYHSFLRLAAPVSTLFWRIDVEGHTGAFEAGGIVMGEAIEPARFYDRDFERGIEPLGGVDINRFGVPSTTLGVTLRTLLFTLSWLGEAEYEETFAPLTYRLGTSLPLYCCFDPGETPWRQNRTYLGFLGRAPFARGSAKPRTMAMELQIRSLI